MNKFFGRLAMVIGTVAVACLVASVAVAKDPVRPMRLESRGTSSPAVDGDSCWVDECAGQPIDVCYNTAGSGKATHLGRAESIGCFYFTGGNWPVLETFGFGSTTAANGDQYNFYYFGTWDGRGDPRVHTYHLFYNGGTGRFENAAGESDCVTTEPVDEAEGTTICVGTISY